MVARHSVVNSRPQKRVNEDLAVIALHGLMRLETFGLLLASYVLKDIVYISKRKTETAQDIRDRCKVDKEIHHGNQG